MVEVDVVGSWACQKHDFCGKTNDSGSGTVCGHGTGWHIDKNGMANDRTWIASASIFGGSSHETGDAGYAAPQWGKREGKAWVGTG
jgi:hypothetical protein